MLDLDRARGTLANAIAPVTGTATGALLSGLLVEYPPAATRLVYLVLLAIVVLQGVGVVLMAETVVRRSGALASLRPHFDVPRPTRCPLLVVGPAPVTRVGTVGLAVGVSISLVATAAMSLIGLFLGMVVAGIGFDSGFQVAIRSCPAARLGRASSA